MTEVLRSTLTIETSDFSGDGPEVMVTDPGLVNGPDSASLDPLAGGTANGKPIWTPEHITAYLNRTGSGWGPTGLHQPGSDTNYSEITYGFHTSQDELFDNGYVFALNGQLFGLSEFFNFTPFTDAQKEATRKAIAYWDDVVAVSFKEVADPFQADIAYGNLTSAPTTQAYTYLPNKILSSNATVNAQVQAIGGDVWVSMSQPSNFQLDEGLYGLNTLVHETGHALGLSHPGAYNAAPGVSITYGANAEYAQDARNYSIMSYFNPRDLGSTSTGVPTRDFDWSLMAIAYGSTPMIHDILAAQAIYGADMTTRTGDTTYGFNSNAGRDAFDFTKTPWPTMTIWDAGGNDTLDASGYKVTQVIDLTPGSLSSIGGITYEDALANLSFAQVNANRAAAGYAPISEATYNANMAAFAADPEWRGRLTDNVGIAYGVTIENAKGGSGKDTIIGNDANNVLEGNAGDDSLSGRNGNDMLVGGVGNDALDGGNGTDTASYAHASGSVTVNLAAGTATGADGNDTLAAIENVIGSSYADRIIGDANANTITAGDGIDVITLGGGNDTFVAELGTKVATKTGAWSWDIITDFDGNGDDLIDLSGLGTLFHFEGTSANKDAGDLTFKVYQSVNGAENALGIDIHDHAGAGGINGPVTVVYANVDGQSPDVAMILLNTNGVDASDFIFPHAAPTALAAAAPLSLNHDAEVFNNHADYMLV
jgi:serralysin